MIKIPCPSIRHLIPRDATDGICPLCDDIGYVYVTPAYPTSYKVVMVKLGYDIVKKD